MLLGWGLWPSPAPLVAPRILNALCPPTQAESPQPCAPSSNPSPSAGHREAPECIPSSPRFLGFKTRAPAVPARPAFGPQKRHLRASQSWTGVARRSLPSSELLLYAHIKIVLKCSLHPKGLTGWPGPQGAREKEGKRPAQTQEPAWDPRPPPPAELLSVPGPRSCPQPAHTDVEMPLKCP